LKENEMPSNPCRSEEPRKGSRLQLCSYVNEHRNSLNRTVLSRLQEEGGRYSSLNWVSPIKADHFTEYRDGDFLGRINLSHLERSLRKFWPANGPCWDGLAVAQSANAPGKNGIILVEAKSHRLEVCGAGCGADGRSKEMIEGALDSTKKWLGVSSRVPWSSQLYQYANRLAHLYFFREIVKPSVEAWLVNVYFTSDPYRPTSEEQWADFLPEVKTALGLPASARYVLDVFLPAVAG
jgi:hypothetical protein